MPRYHGVVFAIIQNPWFPANAPGLFFFCFLLSNTQQAFLNQLLLAPPASKGFQFVPCGPKPFPALFNTHE